MRVRELIEYLQTLNQEKIVNVERDIVPGNSRMTITIYQQRELNKKAANAMEELKTYDEWEEIIAEENNQIVYDPDGKRLIASEGKQDVKMTKREAQRYYMYNTIMPKA